MFQKLCLDKDYLRQVFSFIIYNKIVDNLDSQIEMLEELFSVDNWAGRLDEMEDLWHSIPMPKMTRDAFDFIGAKRCVSYDMGQELREDRLKKYGIDYNDIPHMFSDPDKFMAVFSKLQMYGDGLKKSDLFLLDKNGENAMCQKGTWNNFNLVLELLSRNGETLAKDDFLKCKGRMNAPLAYAAWNGCLDKVFAPELWHGRREEMMALWGYVKPAWTVGIDIFEVKNNTRSPLMNAAYRAWTGLKALCGIRELKTETSEDIFLRFCEGLKGEICNQVVKNAKPINLCLKMEKNRSHPQSCTIHKNEFPRHLQPANIA